MASWQDVVDSEPAFAATVRATFAVRKHATMATTQRDGTPRISGTEVDFRDDGEVYLGMMGGAKRADDLRRDPRVAVHCPTVDPPANEEEWVGDGKLTALAVELPADPTDPMHPNMPPDSHGFRLDLQRVVLTKVAPGGKELEISIWRPGLPLQVVLRA